MVTLALSEDHLNIRRLARDFAQQEIRPIAWQLDAEPCWPSDLLKKAWDVGLVNAQIPERLGGSGLGPFAGALIAEELGWGCSGLATVLMGNGLASAPVVLAGSDDLQRRYVGGLTSAPEVASFCLTEPEAGSDVGGMRTTAAKHGNTYVLNGTKCFITNASRARWFTVFAKTQPEAASLGISAFIVDRDAAGVHVGPPEVKLGQRTADTATVTFVDTPVPASNLIGTENKGFGLAMQTLDRTRPGVAAVAVGIAQAALDLARDYARTRIQFGVPIAMHQAVQFMLADMATSVEAARLLTWKAADQQERGMSAKLMSSHAKRYAADAAMEASLTAVQIFGGHGVMVANRVEKLMRDAKIMQIYEGTSQIQRLVIARELLKPGRG